MGQVTDAIAPTSVGWFAYDDSETGSLSYLGGDNFNNLPIGVAPCTRRALRQSST